MYIGRDQVQELQSALRDLPAIGKVSKLEAVRMLAPEIRALKERRPPASNAQILAVLRVRGLEISEQTFRNYWKQVVRQEHGNAARAEQRAATREDAPSTGLRTHPITKEAPADDLQTSAHPAESPEVKPGYFTPTLYEDNEL